MVRGIVLFFSYLEVGYELLRQPVQILVIAWLASYLGKRPGHLNEGSINMSDIAK